MRVELGAILSSLGDTPRVTVSFKTIGVYETAEQVEKFAHDNQMMLVGSDLGLILPAAPIDKSVH
jgi:hypothetical protein